MIITYGGKDFRIERHPPSGDRSLRAASAADEHILRYLGESGGIESAAGGNSMLILHDRFGALAVPLASSRPRCLVDLKSQEDSILENLEANGLDAGTVSLGTFTDEPSGGIGLAVMRVPKSMDLFDFSLRQVRKHLKPDGRIVAGFMTRHFTPRMLEAAGNCFESVGQSRAWKKSRLLLLDGPRDLPDETGTGITTIGPEDGTGLHQYPGVFSSGHIDTATAFLIENLAGSLVPAEGDGAGMRLLDLGCGNGVISRELHRILPGAEIHALDDSHLAVESARLNLQGSGYSFHWSGNLDCFDDGSLDAVVTNPPFHFEHEIDISVPLRLFGESRRKLKPGGVLLLVANRHLNYSTHLKRSFGTVDRIAVNEGFEVLRALV